MTSKPRTPRYKHVDRQLNLPFQAMVKSMTYWTGTIGDFFEEASASLVKGRRFIAEANVQYCPDVEVIKDQSYLECKACGRSGRLIIYSRRTDREEAWAEEHGFTLNYHIWRHKMVTKEYVNEEELLLDAPRRVIELLVVPADRLYEIARKDPIKVINRWNPLGYTDGWLVPYHKVRDICTESRTRTLLNVQATFQVRLKKLSICSTEPLNTHAQPIRTAQPMDVTDSSDESGRPF